MRIVRVALAGHAYHTQVQRLLLVRTLNVRTMSMGINQCVLTAMTPPGKDNSM